MTKNRDKKSEVKEENVNGGVNFKRSSNSLSNTGNVIQKAEEVLNNTTDSDKQRESNTKVLYQNKENNNNPNSVSNNQVDDKKKYIAPFLQITISELKSLIPNTVIFFLLTFIYSIWRNCKDSFFYELKGTIDGYEPVAAIQVSKIVSFLSTFAVLYLYTKFKPYLTRKKLFNSALFIYLTLLTIFLFILHNRKEYYLLELFSEVASNKSRFINVFAAIVVWPIVIFYVFAELWGTFVLGIIFWMIIHVAYKKEDTGRFYPLLMIGSAVGNILSGIVINRFSFNQNGRGFIDFEKVLPITFISVIIILILYNYIEFSSIKETQNEKQVNKNKEVGFIESLLFVLKRPYLLYIGGMLLGYNLYMGFLENIFKRMLSSCDTIPNCIMSSSKALSIQAAGIGILSLALVFVSHLIKEYTQWKTKALSTPYLALFGIIIFSVPVIYNYIGNNVNIYSIIVICGLVIIIPLKATKYVFFDPTKEQAYKIGTEEEKTTGKMAIDSICSRLAKALSSIIISIFNTLFFNDGSSSQDLLWLFLSLLACLIFLVSVYRLIPLYQNKDKNTPTP